MRSNMAPTVWRCMSMPARRAQGDARDDLVATGGPRWRRCGCSSAARREVAGGCLIVDLRTWAARSGCARWAFRLSTWWRPGTDGTAQNRTVLQTC
jgi:hypothetical protein